MDSSSAQKTAVLYRMAMPEHLCPFGLKSRALLRRQGFAVEDRRLETREEADSFMGAHGVETTPQAFIGGERIGGYEALREHFGLPVRREGEVSYRPVIAIFAMALLIALAVRWPDSGDLMAAPLPDWRTVLSLRTAELFIAISMCLLALQKLQDVEGFSTMFLNYDLLAQRWVGYGHVYPFGEALAGVLMVAGVLIWLAAPVAFVIGTVGAVSVFKAVFIDRRTLKCACVGGSSPVPLGIVSFTENVMMVAMAIWMPIRMAWFD